MDVYGESWRLDFDVDWKAVLDRHRRQAAAHLRKLAGSDELVCTGSEEDRFGRLLARCLNDENDVTKKNRYPLPRVKELLSWL